MSTAKKTEGQADAASAKNVTVTFLKPHSRYSRGDVAGFPEDRVKHLVDVIKVAVRGAELPKETTKEPAAE